MLAAAPFSSLSAETMGAWNEDPEAWSTFTKQWAAVNEWHAQWMNSTYANETTGIDAIKGLSDAHIFQGFGQQHQSQDESFSPYSDPYFYWKMGEEDGLSCEASTTAEQPESFFQDQLQLTEDQGYPEEGISYTSSLSSLSSLVSKEPEPIRLVSSLASLPPPIRVPLGPEATTDASLVPPPGLALPQTVALPEDRGEKGERSPASETAAAPRPTPPPGLESDSAAPPSCISIFPTSLAGVPYRHVEWTIEDLRGKLQASMGRPLVSPSFNAAGLPNLRLMIFPDAFESVKNARSRERKGMYAAMVKKGPLYGALKLKADCLEQTSTVIRFHLFVGSVRRGPFTYDFSESAVHGCSDFGTDWLKQVDAASGNLCVGVEILEAQQR